jgi:Phospholipase_D-nuclease N-terminal
VDVGIFFIILAALLFIGPIAALISIFQRTDSQVAGDSRVLWALVVLFIPFAWVIYFLMGRR